MYIYIYCRWFCSVLIYSRICITMFVDVSWCLLNQVESNCFLKPIIKPVWQYDCVCPTSHSSSFTSTQCDMTQETELLQFRRGLSCKAGCSSTPKDGLIDSHSKRTWNDNHGIPETAREASSAIFLTRNKEIAKVPSYMNEPADLGPNLDPNDPNGGCLEYW